VSLEHIRKVYKGGFMGLIKRKKDVVAIEDLSFSVPKVSFLPLELTYKMKLINCRVKSFVS
jgi:hypothetical protein